MWYQSDEGLDLSRPILAKGGFGNYTYMLLPQIEKGSYDIVGYNWFNVDTGEYNSCQCFKTVKDALDSYKYNCKFKNTTIKWEDN